MLDDNGNYEIVGSVTGPDGKGNAAQPFVSNSGQIGIDPEMWRNNVLKNKDQSPGQPPVFGNGTDDKFGFDVYRCAVGRVSFAGDKPDLFSVPLVQKPCGTTLHVEKGENSLKFHHADKIAKSTAQQSCEA